MNYTWIMGREGRRGIASLNPEQTVTLLRCFMEEEETWETARKTGLSLSEAEQCRIELWNIFAARRGSRA